jgi:hypothetical protein
MQTCTRCGLSSSFRLKTLRGLMDHSVRSLNRLWPNACKRYPPPILPHCSASQKDVMSYHPRGAPALLSIVAAILLNGDGSLLEHKHHGNGQISRGPSKLHL